MWLETPAYVNVIYKVLISYGLFVRWVKTSVVQLLFRYRKSAIVTSGITV